MEFIEDPSMVTFTSLDRHSPDWIFLIEEIVIALNIVLLNI